MLSALRLPRAGFWERLRRFDIERRLALFLTVCAILSGLATYWVIAGTPPFGADVRTVLVLLNLDLILLLCLGVIIARRLVLLWAERRQGSAGSRLHVRLVALFSVVAAAPAILVSIFSVFFLSAGLETWFSDRVRSALDNSLAVAEAYLVEHKEIIRADALAMAADFNREGPLLLLNPQQMRQFLGAQAALRSLTEAIILDSAGAVLARTGLSFTMELDQVPQQALLQAAQGEIVTFTNQADDRVRALVRLESFGDAFLFVGRFIDANVLGFMEQTQRTVSEYRQLESERSSIQITSALLFGVVALLLLFAAVWVGLNFANELAAPISRLISAADRVRTGDLMARVPEGPEADEIQVLSRAFNRMTSQLASQRQELILANQQLDDRRRFTEAVLAGVTAGIIGLDADGRIMLPNRSALDYLARPGEELVGRPFAEVVPEAAALLERLRQRPAEPVQEQILLKRGGRERSLLVRIAAQLDGEAPMGFVVAFDDVTDLISAQRQAAWAEVARRIAHEVKNPLTPIRLAAERLNRKYLGQISEDRDSFTSCTKTIVQQVDTIGRLIAEFSAFARMPAAVMRPNSAADLVRHAVVLQQSAWPQIRFEMALPENDPVPLVCDGEKVSQVLTNLLQNAVDALSEQSGGAAPGGPAITVRVRHIPHAVVIEVQDNGPGFQGPHRERLFDPYVTTRPRGTGLGLAIVRKIMEEHGGKVELADAEGGGALVRLAFPESRA
ncbi:MAG TPA: PAS domain-containing sensor histidine kinase [Geminicoccaceae bacterium]|nr:PAS domain-containing sensor histidine kinase [Geminicoccaceae bacterium]